MKITTIGVDLAKNVFQVHGVDERGKVVLRKQLRRDRVFAFFANLPPCLVGMEACSGAHYWARTLQRFGHTVRLMAPQFVKPYVKTNKNDAADAEAICEAVARPSMRFVAIKSVEQQAILAVHPTAVFEPLDAFWSVNNTLTSPTNIDAGELSASFYRGGSVGQLFLLGNASVDTEEFDDHVVMHEWGHYFEDKFSRSDSIGGAHTIGQSLDARLAFGEGWATALAAIVLENLIGKFLVNAGSDDSE